MFNVQALNTLISALSSTDNLDVETAKQIATHIGKSTSEVLEMTANSIKSILPSYRTIYIIIGVSIAFVVALVALFVYLRTRSNRIAHSYY